MKSLIPFIALTAALADDFTPRRKGSHYKKPKDKVKTKARKQERQNKKKARNQRK